jgi:hypothetical protein
MTYLFYQRQLKATMKLGISPDGLTNARIKLFLVGVDPKTALGLLTAYDSYRTA